MKLTRRRISTLGGDDIARPAHDTSTATSLLLLLLKREGLMVPAGPCRCSCSCSSPLIIEGVLLASTAGVLKLLKAAPMTNLNAIVVDSEAVS